MTTIAYKDGTLAADTLATAGDTRIARTIKITKTASGRLVGASGRGVWCHRLRVWAETVDDENFPLPENDEGSGVVIGTDGSITAMFSGGIYPITAPYYAIGSGTDHAMAVMEFGGSSEDAVRVSIALDIHSGGEITVLKLGETQ